MGLPEEDFNSYATHRGDHLTAQRATFANPTLSTRWPSSTAR
jgi:aconitate hydratase